MTLEKEVMRTNNMKLQTLEIFIVRPAGGFAFTMFFLLLLGLLVGFANPGFAQNAQPKPFASPGDAAHALFEAAQKGDEQALEAILGAGKEITSSSDEIQDKLEREQFSRKYQEMHRLVREPDGSTVLYIGAENWPFPIPLVSKNSAWHFDSETGKQEIRFRRIGENEATAIGVCEEFAMAKNGSAAKAVSYDPITQFAESLVSAGADTPNKESTLFHGYYFRIVTEKPATGTKRLGLVAYPSEYQSSGVMTFVVTRGGIAYEKDLGSKTTTLAKDLQRGPDSSWHTAE
jgi:Protein of unknown function (DUF2950)